MLLAVRYSLRPLRRVSIRTDFRRAALARRAGTPIGRNAARRVVSRLRDAERDRPLPGPTEMLTASWNRVGTACRCTALRSLCRSGGACLASRGHCVGLAPAKATASVAGPSPVKGLVVEPSVVRYPGWSSAPPRPVLPRPAAGPPLPPALQGGESAGRSRLLGEVGVMSDPSLALCSTRSDLRSSNSSMNWSSANSPPSPSRNPTRG